MAERSEVASQLDRLAQRRAQQAERTGQLSAEIRQAVADAQAAQMPVTEIARRLGLDRSALYRTYLAA